MTLKLQCITVDASDPHLLASFWAEVLGWKVGEDVNDIEVWIERERTKDIYLQVPSFHWVFIPHYWKCEKPPNINLRLIGRLFIISLEN